MAKRPTPKQFWRILHKIADRNIGPVERAFLRAGGVAQASVNESALIVALHQRDGRAVLAALHLDIPSEQLRNQLAAVLRATLNQAAVATETAMDLRDEAAAPKGGATMRATASADLALTGFAEGAGRSAVGFRFDLTNPQAVKWAQQHAAELVREVNKTIEKNIRRVIVRGFREGRTVDVMARDIRQLAGFGLTRRQSEAVENLRTRLEDVAELTFEQIDAKVERYVAKQLRLRAKTIARTETMTASNQGQQELWRQTSESGLLGDDARRIFIVTPDDRLCEICAAVPDLNPDGVALDEPFQTPEGPVDTPPVHPNCRCSMGLVFNRAKVREAA